METAAVPLLAGGVWRDAERFAGASRGHTEIHQPGSKDSDLASRGFPGRVAGRVGTWTE